MTKIEKRLDNLEGAAKPDRGHVVLWSDLDQVGVYWDQPFSAKNRRKYTEDDRRELEKNYDDVLVIRYVKDWRSETA